MTPEEREALERRLIQINPPELDAGEMDALYEERDLIMKELDEDVD